MKKPSKSKRKLQAPEEVQLKSLVKSHSLFTEFDVSLFKSGKHFRLYEKFGAHPMTFEGEEGVYFSVWAPSAKSVSVVGDFNDWKGKDYELNVRWDESGIWEGFIPNAKKGQCYKFRIHSNHADIVVEKVDPYALYFEEPPRTAGIIWDISDFKWKDDAWMSYRKDKNGLDRPYSVYELHLGSWRKNAEGGFLTYKELAKTLVDYVKEMNFTHVELMPVMEFPYDPSWGYQLVGYFAPSARFGNPAEFMELIQAFHQNDIGVILDWVPSHFPSDDHGLGYYDGTHLYEHPDRKKGYHKDWKSLIFNYERNEVRSFLVSNAFFWLDKYHADGLRIDAVASMIYLDYSREEGEWDPNEFGGNENLSAISFLQLLNESVYNEFEGVQTIAEESTAFPKVTKPVSEGGLGFGMKWMVGWMHDTLKYFSKDPIHRSHHQNDITFSLAYAFSENFMLPISHDEVVHGKKSVLSKMPGDEWQRFANLRVMYGLMFSHPGAKLLFMGAEFGQYDEWDFNKGLDWNLLEYIPHQCIQRYIRDLNACYVNTPALYEKAFSPEGFEWISHDDHKNAVISFIRKGHDSKNDRMVICNLTPVPRKKYRIGFPSASKLTLQFNSDETSYGGSGHDLTKKAAFEAVEWKGNAFSVLIDIPPLSMVMYDISRDKKKS